MSAWLRMEVVHKRVCLRMEVVHECGCLRVWIDFQWWVSWFEGEKENTNQLNAKKAFSK